ncbi:MAG: CBS domain-containing protein [Promethearchaeota archaeon]
MSLKNLKAKDIMLKEVVTCRPKEKLGAVDLKMIRAAIGGMPVINENKELVGIITQRDIMLSRFTAQITSSNVEDIMTREVIVCNPETSLKEILKLMLENQIERLPVVDESNRLLGLIVHKTILSKIYEYI